MGFFENGDTQLIVVRTVHYGDEQDPLSQTALRGSATLLADAAVPTPAELLGAPVGRVFVQDSDSLVVAVDGGAPVTATVVVTRAELVSALVVVLDDQDLAVVVGHRHVFEQHRGLGTELVDHAQDRTPD